MRAYLKDDTGASAAEYAILLGVIGAAVAVALIALSGPIASRFGSAAEVLNSADGQVASATTTDTPGAPAPVTPAPGGPTNPGTGGHGSGRGQGIGGGQGSGIGQGAGGGRGHKP